MEEAAPAQVRNGFKRVKQGILWYYLIFVEIAHVKPGSLKPPVRAASFSEPADDLVVQVEEDIQFVFKIDLGRQLSLITI